MSNTNSVEIVEDKCAENPFPTTLVGLALSIGKIRCGLSEPSQRPAGASVGIGRSMRWIMDDDGAGSVRLDDCSAVLIPELVRIVG